MEYDGKGALIPSGLKMNINICPIQFFSHRERAPSCAPAKSPILARCVLDLEG
jgi:hypothetical protein